MHNDIIGLAAQTNLCLQEKWLQLGWESTVW